MNFTRPFQNRVATALLTGMLSVYGLPALADWSDSANSLGVQTATGSAYVVDCPAGGTGGTIWGTGIYTSDSSICMAAVHTGFFTQAMGGQVTFRVLGPQQTYAASSNNGVTSEAYGPWSSSFMIISSTGHQVNLPVQATSVTWTQSPISLQLGLGPHAISCPSGGSLASTIWGTDVYTSDSAICVAAVHSGRINAAAGGTVHIQMLGDQPAFVGSSRNGVTSEAYGPWDSSYLFTLGASKAGNRNCFHCLIFAPFPGYLFLKPQQ
ncbi:hypothetical protein E2K80_12820 [Rhodophyticola sp. CCM32]|uniref:LCCL domain-containing protein n=1 Tax=Rhodophyticola sp. CCM32 TaxID=2916397 RepID=UPI00107F8422|nr:LCCL domain-containing protein [Rhodophyticola sp. CCM32]QBY01495.1 hypothetical protein E2K80_12820 [Rhodophyticola sp. CCM32]